MLRRRAAVALALLSLAPLARADQVPSPESVLGWRVGEDRKLADWSQIVDYFKKLDEASPRVVTREVGRTTQGRPFLVVTITSEANMGRLEQIRRDNLRLADPRALPQEEANRLIAGARTIVAINHGIHSTEVAATQTAMESAYRLATGNDPDLVDILDKTVILMLPSHNPDGTQIVTEWYRKTVGTPYEGSAPPVLYHHYTGHDNNRDWYMFTQAESLHTVRHLYDAWRPQVVYDLHQMGARAARMFAPPYVDPWEPNVDPALRAGVNAIGSHMAARLIAEGKPGVVIHAMYDGWTPARAYPHTHGGVRILTESASARLATPIDLKFEQLEAGIGYDAKTVSWNYPLLWRGGTWRLRDIVDYQLSATRALLEHAARNREYWVRNFLEVNRRGAERSEPSAFVIPADQKDPLATARLLQVLRLGAVEVHRARATFVAGGKSHGAGSYVVLMQQPFSAHAKALLERQRYPDLRVYPGGPPQRPYDVTAHTLPLLLGVEVEAVPERFQADLEPVEAAAVAPGRVEPRGRWLALGHKNADLIALGRLLRAKVPVRWATAAFTDRGRSFPAGTLLVPASARLRLTPMATELGIAAQAVNAAPAGLTLRAPRVGLYKSWVPSMDEGWTRFIFEKEVGVDYTTLHDADVRAGGLEQRFDVIVIPDQSRRQIVNGHAQGSMPPEFVGGLGADGVAALKRFTEAGGTLVTLNEASELAITDLAVPAKNVLSRPEPEGPPGGRRRPPTDAKDLFYCPGAILRVDADLVNPLAHGLEPSSIAWFEESPAFEVGGGAILRYTDANPLLSGWLLGGQKLQGKAALVESPLGRGRVVMFGFRPQYRAQSWATYIPLLNAIYTSAAQPPASRP